MSKSSLSILAIGVCGMILLSLMMKHLGEVSSQQGNSPYAAAVQSKLGAKLVGPVRIADLTEGGVRRLRVSATVLAGLRKRPLAQTIGREVWLGALRRKDGPDELVVVLEDDAGEERLECKVPSPIAKVGSPPAERQAPPGKAAEIGPIRPLAPADKPRGAAPTKGR